MNAPRRVLLVGGLDPTGGAGLAADVKMAWALGVHPLTVASCLTVQNRHGFQRRLATADVLLAQMIAAAVEDGPVAAIKLGLCADAASLERTVASCQKLLPGVPMVVDPVLSATSGGLDLAPELCAAYRSALPAIFVLTPNVPELELLAPVSGAAEELLESGCRHVLLKGGHAPAVAGEAIVEDRLVSRQGTVTFRHPRFERGPIHGTGCALATAVAARLARGAPVEEACRGAVADVACSIEKTPPAPDGLAVPLSINASRSSA